ncbi:response regulator [Flavobacterium alkalisoli]|uniref:histidine kinase n=1 Tax=Flavobacterium alkalisoli TaxID=2602769 RepID=A0A5B9FUG8_9FLAO|nr:ATP-binding protein [Flavobacterium alkalisoli]QEE49851.1 response regulator [Flavobacterium alkalisoli]
MFVKKIILLCFTLLPFVNFAQNIKHLSVRDGLPQSFVSGIVEDNDGFIWVSTHNGLTRYDGHQFKIFQNRPDDITSISSNFITQSIKDRHNNLWLRYDSGSIDVFNMASHKVNHIITNDFLNQNNLVVYRRGWQVASDCSFWFISKDETVYNFILPKKGQEYIKPSLYKFNGSTVLTVMEDSKKNIWVLTTKGLNRFSAQQKKFELFEVPYKTSYDNNFDFGEEIPLLTERKNGELIWMDKNHLYFFNPSAKTYRKADFPEEAHFNGKLLATAPDGKVYFQVNKTIYSYDDKQGIEKKTDININNERDTQALLVDGAGLIWLGANTDGVYQIDIKDNFEVFRYKKDFAVDLFEKELGISVYNFFNISATDRGLLSPSYYLRSLHDTERGITWVAMNRTVAYFDDSYKKIKKLPELPAVSYKEFVPIKGISLSEDNKLIVIDQDNTIYRYDEGQSAWEKIFNSNKVKEALGFKVNPSGILADDNKIWITSEYNGLLCIDLKNGKLEHIAKDAAKTLPVNKLYGIVPDKKCKNIFWIASTQGLLRFDRYNFETTLYSVDEGLPDNMIYSILMDKEGYLWLGTNKGLCRFHSQTYKVRTFTEAHGLPCYEFNRYHQFSFPDGKIAFGGVNSGVLFDPVSIDDDNFNPNTVITCIKINNELFKGGSSEAENTIKLIRLPYDQNTLQIEYAAMEFNQPQDILYRYRLKGYDNDWILAGNKREAIYTKVPPGNYQFEVNATNSTGKWSTIIKTIEIKISPPWWKTWWAFTLYIIAAIIVSILFINYSIQQGLIKNEILLKQKEAQQLREMDEVKSRFFSNITHELRTPITLIMGPAEQLKTLDSKEQQGHLLSIISKNAGSLLNLTNQLLDIAKLEAGALKPYKLWGDVVAAVKQVIVMFSEEASTKNNEIIFEGPETAEYFFAPDILERILYNLLSNALKYSYLGGKVFVRFSESEKGIVLEVQDTGRGIPHDEQSNIFKRFYHIDGKSKEVGTGIGLSLVKELIDLEGGTIDVKSDNTKNNHGTTFTVLLPYRKAVETIDNNPPQVQVNEKDDDSGLSDSKPLILLVEDNRELANFIEGSLNPYYTIYRAQNGKEGLELALSIMPDLILSDVLMEGMDGFEMCKHLKSDINTDHIPVIMLTAKVDMGSKLEGLSYGADDYLTKPFNVTELLLRIENRLELLKKQRKFIYRKLKLLPDEVEQNVSVTEDPFLNKMYAVIDTRLDDETFSMDELASALNISRSSLHRKIKSLTNMSTTEIVKIYRLKKAVSLLHENYTISEVAYKTGFGSPSYFSKSFKEVYSLTPTEYIQKKDSLRQ